MATKKEIIEQVQALISAEVSEETLTNVVDILNQMGRKVGSAKRPTQIEIDGTTYKWCNRHGQYEPIDWFMVEKGGKIKPECTAAYFKWQQYGKDINAALKAEDYEAIGKLTLLRKKGGYDLKQDAEEFADKIEETLGFKLDASEAISEEDALKSK